MSERRIYKILLTNDDGISSSGIDSLKKEISKIGAVLVVAPNIEMSGISHAITVREDIIVKKYFKNGDFFGYGVDGTPADCVKLGVLELMSEKADLVISGINEGENTGLNILYSGTVSAAAEAAVLGIPSFAISLSKGERGDFGFAAEFARKLAVPVLKNGLPEGTYLNVNIPPVLKDEIKGVSITRQGNERFLEYFTKNPEKIDEVCYKINGKRNKTNNKSGTEESAIYAMHISVTPIRYDMTNYKMIEELKKWNISI